MSLWTFLLFLILFYGTHVKTLIRIRRAYIYAWNIIGYDFNFKDFFLYGLFVKLDRHWYDEMLLTQKWSDVYTDYKVEEWGKSRRTFIRSLGKRLQRVFEINTKRDHTYGREMQFARYVGSNASNLSPVWTIKHLLIPLDCS